MELKNNRFEGPRMSKSVMNRQVDELLDESDSDQNSESEEQMPQTLKEALWK